MFDCVTREMNCPTCGKKHKVDFWPNISVLQNKKVKEKVLDASLFQLKCKRCKKVTKLEYSCFYLDETKKIIVCSIVKDEWQNAYDKIRPYEGKGYKIRFVPSNVKLHEKIKIFESGLKDTIIEYLKIQLAIGLAKDEKGQLDVMQNSFFTGLAQGKDGGQVLNFYYCSKTVQYHKTGYDGLLSVWPEEFVNEEGKAEKIVNFKTVLTYYNKYQ